MNKELKIIIPGLTEEKIKTIKENFYTGKISLCHFINCNLHCDNCNFEHWDKVEIKLGE